MTTQRIALCHCEERSDEAIPLPQQELRIGVHRRPPVTATLAGRAGRGSTAAVPWPDRRLNHYWRGSHGDGEADCGEPAERAAGRSEDAGDFRTPNSECRMITENVD